MSEIRVALMGFGRISRDILRQVHDRDDIHIVAISELGTPESVAYLAEYDTIYGRFPAPVELADKHLTAGRQRARILRGHRPDEMPWDAYGVDVVVEATHAFRRRADLQGHLDAGARRVILSTPAEDPIDLTLLHGINHDSLRPEHCILSCSSATTVALGLILKILDDAIGVERAMMTTVHAYTSDQKLADAMASDLRRSRSAAENIIPNRTWSPRVVEEVLPSLRGRIGGLAVNVPVPCGSTLDLSAQLKNDVSRDELNDIIRQAAGGTYARWLEYSDEPLVSSDVIGNPHSAVFDSLATLSLDTGLVKTITWYDSGWGYAARIVETIEAIARLEEPEAA